MVDRARVIADFGKAYLVKSDSGHIYHANTRAKKVDYACGDVVEVTILNDEQVVIENHLPRRNVLYRADLYKSKTLASNLDQILFIAAVEPKMNKNLLQRAMLAAEASVMDFLIILNKIDLAGSLALQEHLQFYQDLNYTMIELSAKQTVEKLWQYLKGKTSLLVGQSGVGKSTIINGLVGDNRAKVNSLSDSLNMGRHTTTHSIMYTLDEKSFIIDSPGLQKFGLSYISVPDLIQYFPDFKAYIGQCRFHNCQHQEEPGCILKEKAAQGLISQERLDFLREITRENSRKKY